MNEFRPRWSEDWRGIIEQVRQLGPDRTRLMLEEMKTYQPKGQPGFKAEHILDLPTGVVKRGIATGCNHYPFNNAAYHLSLVELTKHVKPDFFVFAGDVLDCFSVSAHNRGQWDMPGYTLKDEYDETNLRLDEVCDVLPDACEKIFIEGNHENRIRRFQASVDNAKLGGALTDYIAGLRLIERGFNCLAPYKEAQLFIGDLIVLHGLYTNANAGKTHLEKLGQSCLFFHTHKFQTYSGRQGTAYNCGGGGDWDNAAFYYAAKPARADWSNGAAVIDLHENGKTVVTPLEYDGQFWFEGKKF